MSAFASTTSPPSSATPGILPRKAPGSPAARVAILVLLVAGFIIIYAVLISPALHSGSDLVSGKKSHADPKGKKGKGGAHDKSAAKANKAKKKDDDDEEEDEVYTEAPSRAPANRMGDGVPPGRGHHFDEQHIKMVRDMVENARKNGMPDPFEGVAPEELEDHIRAHKEGRVVVDNKPGGFKRPHNRIDIGDDERHHFDPADMKRDPHPNELDEHHPKAGILPDQPLHHPDQHKFAAQRKHDVDYFKEH